MVLGVVPDVVPGVAVGTVVFFLEHRGEASCPKSGKPCAGDDAVDGSRFTVHRAPRGGRDRSAERGVGVAERTDSTDQADGVRVPEPRAPRERDPVPSPKAGSPSEAGLNPHDCLKRQKCVVPTRICPNKGARR